MQNVCTACHGTVFVHGHYLQYDASVRLYNEKFAVPAQKIISMIEEKNLLPSEADFGNDIQWVYWELWHHEGRRARHGSAMMGPDYTWWHGFYEVAKHFYFELIPGAKAFNNPEVNQYIDDLLTNDPMHNWLMNSKTNLKEAIRSGELQNRYMKFFKQASVPVGNEPAVDGK